MSSTRFNSKDKCSPVQELIAWYPGGSLDTNECALVEEHAAECSRCAALLRFVSEFKEVLIEKWAYHPSADALVSYAENRAAMDLHQRSLIDDHIAACSDCREQVAMLEKIETSGLEETSRTEVNSAVRDSSGDALSRLRDFWESLKGGVLRPVPAAVYLTVAVLALGFHIFRSNGQSTRPGGERHGEIGLAAVAESIPTTLSGVVLLPDETYRPRRPDLGTTAGVRVGTDRAQLLLLELTNLEDPPKEDQTYTVEIQRNGSAAREFVGTVMGREFRDNYTLCLSLSAGALEPGVHVVRVNDPDGKAIFRSTVIAE